MWCAVELVRNLCVMREVLCSNPAQARSQGIHLFFLTEEGVLLPVIDPGLKSLPFTPGFLLPVGKPGLKGDLNRE